MSYAGVNYVRVGRWAGERLAGSSDDTPLMDAYEDYRRWWNRHGTDVPLSKRDFVSILIECGVPVIQPTSNYTVTWAILGHSLLTEEAGARW
jgi:phage/plasmid-associated DNA primase